MKGPSPKENSIERLDFVNPNKPGLRWPQREQVSVDSFKGDSVTPWPQAAASAVSQWGYPPCTLGHRITSGEGTGGRVRCASAAGFDHHRSGGGEEHSRGRRAGESPREGAAAPGFIAFFSHVNAVVIEISSSPRQALVTHSWTENGALRPQSETI